jgi:hypothetical protein
MNEKQKRLAVLIDADNSQASIIDGLLDEIATQGVASVKRIYGDWTDTRLKKWKEILLDYGIEPIQQFAYTTGKNATDSALIIDAMDLLYTGNFEGFCIVSSDSDFTRLASRIRQSGLLAYGFGEKKTPKAFRSACDKFVYIENLRKNQESTSQNKDITKDEQLLKILKNAVDDTSDYAGWSYLGSVGVKIANKMPEFDPRSYGFKKLGDLMEATDFFEFKTSAKQKTKSVYIRPKRIREYA